MTNLISSSTCPGCGSSVNPSAQFCPFCGTAIVPASAPPAPASTAPASPALVAAPPADAPAPPTGTPRAQCEMIVGFLVPHRCDNPALGRCIQCGRGYCDEHVNVTTSGLRCLACQQGLEQPIALPLTAQSYDANDLATFHAASQWDNDDDTFSDLS